MKQSSNIQEIRKNYNFLKEEVGYNRLNRINAEEAKIQYEKVTEQMKNMQKKNQTANMQELAFYKSQYQRLETIIEEKAQYNYSKNDYQKQLFNLFEQKKSQNVGKEMYTIQEVDSNFVSKNLSEVMSDPSKKKIEEKNTRSVIDFLREKQKKTNMVQSGIGFQKVLEEIPISKRNFKVKQSVGHGETYSKELENAKQENLRLRQMLNHSKTNQYQQDQQTEQARRQLIQLQEKVKQLSEYNERIREKTASYHPSQHNTQQYLQDDENDGQYNLKVRKNNLIKIQQENINRKGSDYNYQINRNQAVNVFQYTDRERDIYQRAPSEYRQKSQIDGNRRDYSEVGSYDLKYKNQDFLYENNFQTFIKPKHLEKSPFIIRDAFLGIKDPLTCSRNKVAFFKGSMNLTTDRFCEISFKRSQLNRDLDEITIEFYIKNKSSSNQLLHIGYKDESKSYIVNVKQKITTIKSGEQKRQVVVIKLNNSVDLDSIIDGIFQFTQQSKNIKTLYELYIPANFINFDNKYRQPESSALNFNSRKAGIQKRTIKPDDQFRSYEHCIQAGLPLCFKQEGSFQTTAWLYGESKCYSGGVCLSWKNGRKLTIEGSEKWIDWIAFILCELKWK